MSASAVTVGVGCLFWSDSIFDVIANGILNGADERKCKHPLKLQNLIFQPRASSGNVLEVDMM